MKKIVSFILILIIVLVGASWFIFNSMLSPENAKKLITQDISEKLGRKITLDSIEINFFKGITAKNFTLYGNPAFGDYKQIQAEKMYLKPNYFALLFKTLLFDTAILDNPQIIMHKDEKGKFDFTDITGTKKEVQNEEGKSGMTLAVAELKINNGSLSFTDKSPSLEAFIAAKNNSKTNPALKKNTLFEGKMENINITGHLDKKNLTMSLSGSAVIPNGAEKILFSIPVIGISKKGTILVGEFSINKFSATYLKPYIAPSFPIDIKSGIADIKGEFKINPNADQKDIKMDIKARDIGFNHASLPIPVQNLSFEAQITPEKGILHNLSTQVLTLPITGSGQFTFKDDPAYDAAIEIKEFNPGSLKTTLTLLAGAGGPLSKNIPKSLVDLIGKDILSGNLSFKVNSKGKFADIPKTGSIKIQSVFKPSNSKGLIMLNAFSPINSLINFNSNKIPAGLTADLTLQTIDTSSLIPFLPTDFIKAWQPESSGLISGSIALGKNEKNSSLLKGSLTLDQAGFKSKKFQLPISVDGKIELTDNKISSNKLKASIGKNIINTTLSAEIPQPSSPSILPFDLSKISSGKLNFAFDAPSIDLTDLEKSGLVPEFLGVKGDLSINKGKLQGTFLNLEGGATVQIKSSIISIFSTDTNGTIIKDNPLIVPVDSFTLPVKILKSVLKVDSAEGIVCTDSKASNVFFTDLTADILRKPGNFSTKLVWKDINVEKLISANSTVQYLLKGTGHGSINIKGTLDDGVQSLQGEAETDIQKGEWEFIGTMSSATKNLASLTSSNSALMSKIPGISKVIEETSRLIPDISKMSFSQIKNTKPISIKNGIINCDEITVTTPEKELIASGTLDLTSKEMSFDIGLNIGKIDLKGKISGKSGELIDKLSSDQRSIPLIIGAKGTFTNPQIKWSENLDDTLNAIIKNALKNEGKEKLNAITGNLLNKVLKKDNTTSQPQATSGESTQINSSEQTGQESQENKVDDKIQKGLNKFLKKVF